MSVLVVSDGKPVIDNPYLSIVINRNDLGHSFDLGVNKQNQNLVITGENFPRVGCCDPLGPAGPPAPYVGFPGSSTYYQRSYGHVAPFLAFPAYKPGYPWDAEHQVLWNQILWQVYSSERGLTCAALFIEQLVCYLNHSQIVCLFCHTIKFKF